MDIIKLLSYFLLGFSSLDSIRAITLIRKGKISGYLFVLPILIIFYVLPIFLDILLGSKFDNYYSIYEALESSEVETYYNLYISIILFFFSYKAKAAKRVSNKSFSSTSITSIKLGKLYDDYKYLIWICFVFPLFYTLIFGNLDYYSYYTDRESIFFDRIPESHQIINKFTLFGSLIGAFILSVLIHKRKQYKQSINLIFLFTSLILLIYFWIDGKRGIFAQFGLFFIVLIFLVNGLSIRKALISSFIISALFVGSIWFYGKNISSDFEQTYKSLRVDFGRDYGVKFVIYNDLILERNILPSKFDSFIFTLTFFVPREIWNEKPQPYAVYFTNSAFGNFGGDNYYGWGLTTSIITESISNLGLSGVVFGPLIIFLILKKEASSSSPVFKSLSILIAILLLLVQAVAFMPLILLYILMLSRLKRR